MSTTNPARPWFILRTAEGEVKRVSQDPIHEEKAAEIVEPAWLSPTRCRRKRPHEPHTWGGEGWSPYRCTGEALGSAE